VIAVDGNPANDISAIRNVRPIIKDGEIVHQSGRVCRERATRRAGD
jgi:hypothetical protein